MSQEIQTIRLSVQTGGNVAFIFNSFKKYDNGIVYTDYTKLAVDYSHTIAGVHQGTHWKLDFKANTANIEGSSNNLDLRTLELTASDGGGLKAATSYSTDIPLSNSDNITLVSGGPEGDFNDNLINITYNCGTNAAFKVLNEKPDYYVVDIIFTAISTP